MTNTLEEEDDEEEERLPKNKITVKSKSKAIVCDHTLHTSRSRVRVFFIDSLALNNEVYFKNRAIMLLWTSGPK